MKDGVMLINTSRSALINILDVLEALENGKIAYLGIDVYEYEKGLFFEANQENKVSGPIASAIDGSSERHCYPAPNLFNAGKLCRKYSQSNDPKPWICGKPTNAWKKPAFARKNCNITKTNNTQQHGIDAI